MTNLIISEALPYQLKMKKCNLAVQCQSMNRNGQSVSSNDSFWMTKLSGPILCLCHVTCEIGSCALALKKVVSDTVKAICVEEK